MQNRSLITKNNRYYNNKSVNNSRFLVNSYNNNNINKHKLIK